MILKDFGGSGVIAAKNMKKCRFQDASWRPLGGQLGAKMRQVGAKMAPSWPTWRQDGAKMANLEAKMSNLAHFWKYLGDFFLILGLILRKKAKTEKTTTVHHF